MKYIKKRVLSLIISLVLGFLAVTAAAPAKEAEAASKYIKVDAFIKYAVEQLRLPVDKSSKTPYVDAAMKVGILKKGDFKGYSGYLTRTDCAVVANRIDKYLYGEYFGYTKELYEFLKGCNYVNGRLYYNIKGNLYPADSDDIEYKANYFLADVVLPRLKGFSFEKNLSAVFQGDFQDGIMKGMYVEIGLDSGDPYVVDPFSDEDYLIQAWQKIVDGERLFSIVYEKRISDLSKVSKNKRQDVAEAYAKGLIKGYSNGMYVQSRSLKGSNKATAAGARGMILMAIDKDKRAKISPDGQLIRTTNLPKNADEYPYILACFPNEFYEMVFDFQRDKPYKEGTMSRSRYWYPNEVGNTFLVKRYSDYLMPSMMPYEYYDTLTLKAKQYVNNVFDVNYKSVGQSWRDNMKSVYTPFSNSDPYLSEKLDEYIKWIKENHVVVESKVITVEPSTLYWYDMAYYIRVYVKYRITADTIDVDFDYKLLFGNKTTTYLVGLKNGEWTYGYYDILMSGAIKSNSCFELGVNADAGISDGPLKGSK